MRPKTAEHFPWLRGLFAALGLLSLLLLPGCGEGDSDSDPLTGVTGQVVIGLTDAAGDFLVYNVDVLSLTLTRADGTVVQALPMRTRVDFAQYTDMTEFVTVANIPVGRYTQAKMQLDYTNADIQVDVGGVATPAEARNSAGDLITTLDMDVRLAIARPLLIVAGVPAHLTLDFDLEATHELDTNVNPVIATVEPLLIADVNPQAPKIHRLRGPVQSVEPLRSRFTVALRPFHHRVGDFGRLVVHTDTSTMYEIDGEMFSGDAGLAALDAKPFATAVVVRGDLVPFTRHFKATEVYAGSSVPWGDNDAVTGNVIARSADTLTLRGATLVRQDGSVIFNDNVSVTVGVDTKVIRQAKYETGLDKDDISVGQRLTVLGELTNNSPGSLALDATQGLARLNITDISGEVVSLDSGNLVMQLQRIHGRQVTLFDFSGTGTLEDADPNNYEVATGSIALSSLAIGEPLRVRGFVRAFGQAPEDFDAISVLDASASIAHLLLHWNDAGSSAPFSSASADSIVVDLSSPELSDLHHIIRLGVSTDLLDLSTAATVEPRAADGEGLYAIAHNGVIQLHTQFDKFEADLSSRLDGSRALKGMVARGSFDDASVTLSAGGIAVKLNTVP